MYPVPYYQALNKYVQLMSETLRKNEYNCISINYGTLYINISSQIFD